MTSILVAEEGPEVWQVIQQLLADQGYEIIKSSDGRSAYATAVLQKPGIILLNIMLPEMNGFEVLRRLKDNPDTASIPVIIITARNQPEDEKLALRLGAVDFITKPWAPGELETRVRMVLTYLQSPLPNRLPSTAGTARHSPLTR